MPKRNLPEPPVWAAPAEPTRLTYDIRVITPLFGGGYEPGEVDAATVIRPAAIRGHLRFWWRATAGARYGTPQELFAAEEALWGSAASDSVRSSGPGAVSVAVDVTRCGTPRQCARFETGTNGKLKSFPTFQPGWPSYALHPFQGNVKGGQLMEEPAYAQVDVAFTLSLILRDERCRSEVEAACAAWVAYGGIGARTRRGCGSLATAEPLPVTSAAADAQGELKVPVLSGSLVVKGAPTNDSISAWSAAVGVYRDFRQKEGFARNTGSQSNRPGRSKWPEPDAIRRLTGSSTPLHRPTHAVQHGFPRADLGLPIVFHFKDKGAGDPDDAVLEATTEGAARMASPAITKAVALEDGRYAPLLLVLNAPHAWAHGDLAVGGTRVPPAWVNLPEAERQKVSPLAGLPVREALIAYAEERWATQREVLA